jgi:hypothetical protein
MVSDEHDYQTREWGFFGRNLALIKWLFPDTPLATTVESQALLLEACRSRFERVGLPGLRRIHQPLTLEVCLDVLMGTTVLIRGQDWNSRFRDPSALAFNCGEIGWHLSAIFESLTGRRPEVFYHPLLIDSSKRKLSKRWSVRQYTVEALRQKFSRMDLFAYAAGILGWDGRQALDAWIDQFDLLELQQMEAVEFSLESLEEASRWVSHAFGSDRAEEAYRSIVAW